jgi:Amt family ammonium transporter
VLGHAAEQGQANIPLLNGLMPSFRFPESSLVYFLSRNQNYSQSG